MIYFRFLKYRREGQNKSRNVQKKHVFLIAQIPFADMLFGRSKVLFGDKKVLFGRSKVLFGNYTHLLWLIK